MRVRPETHKAKQRHPTQRRSSGPTARITAALLATGTVAIPLARGGTPPWAIGGCVLVATLALFVSASRGRPIAAPGFVLGGLVLWSGVQLVPLPAALHAVSPGALRVFETSLAPIGLYPSALPFALDPAAAAIALAQAIACTGVFVAASTIPARGRSERIVVLGLAIAGAIVTGVVAARALAGSGPLVGPRLPFRNPNHLAGFLNLTVFVTLGVAVGSRGSSRVLWLLASAMTAALVLLTLSRGGMGAFALGATLTIALHARGRRARDAAIHTGRRAVSMGVGILAGVGTAAFLALHPILGELRTLGTAPSDVKLQLWPVALRIVRDFPLTGIGRGAFETVFTGYQLETYPYTFTHAENEWLQAVIDLGVPAGLILVGTFGLVWLLAARRRDLTPVEIGLVAGVAAVATHNVFDFSLEVAGVALPFAVAAGLLARSGPSVKLPVSAVRSAAVMGAAAAAACLAVASGREVTRSDRALSEIDLDRLPAAAAAVARWRPADWGPHAAAGIRLARDGKCATAAPWLMRAMALHPAVPGPHRAMARCLAGANPAAAKREYRLAFLFGDLGTLADAAAQFPKIEDLVEIAPATPEGMRILGEYLAQQRPAEAAIVYRRLLDEYRDEAAEVPLAVVLSRLERFDEALPLAREHAARRPGDPEGYLAAARALVGLGRDAEAVEVVQRGVTACPGSAPLLRFLVERSIAAGRWTEARQLAEEIVATTPGDVAARMLLVARALAGQGRLGEAIERAQSAAAVIPDSPEPSLMIAAWCEAAGRYEEGIAAMRHADALAGRPSQDRAEWIHRLERRRVEQLERDLARRALLGGGGSDPRPLPR